MLIIKQCILCYGLEDVELLRLKELGFRIKVIKDSMAECKIRDIINDNVNNDSSIDLPNEKVILFNGYDNRKLKPFVNKIRQIVEDSILAVVTPISSSWKFKDLIKHLIEEKEWENSNKKG